MEFVKKDDEILIEAPCKYCGGVYASLHEGKGPHVAELKCNLCKRHNQWMSLGNMDLYECHLSASFLDTLMVKILNAKSEVETSLLSDDWIARKVADKRLKTLEVALEKSKAAA